ncbi:MAG: helix-turn-helix domain-containing protein [Methylocystis sp.]|jgi:hypothetical protein
MLKDRLPPPSPDRCLQHSNGQRDPLRNEREPGHRDVAQFHRDKFLWLEQVHADPLLTPLAFRLAYVLADLVNEGTGYAWPSVAFLAAECRATERGVQKIVRQLIEHGHLFVEFGQGRGETNRYRWIVKGRDVVRRGDSYSATASQMPSRESEAPPPCRSDGNGRTVVHPIQSKKVNHGSAKGEQRFQEGRTPVRPTQSKESIYDPIYRSSSEQRAQNPPSRFEEFWRVYPKKVALTDAIGAFAQAIERAPLDEIIRGAMRYAAERDGENPRYTKNPATWLNKACWRDQTPSSSGHPRDGVPARRQFDRSALAQMHDADEFDEVVARIQQRTSKRG